MRELASQIFGFLAAYGLKTQSEFEKCVSDLVHDTVNKKTLLEHQHGQLLAMAHSIERSIVVLLASGAMDRPSLLNWDIFSKVIHTICKYFPLWLCHLYSVLLHAVSDGIFFDFRLIFG